MIAVRSRRRMCVIGGRLRSYSGSEMTEELLIIIWAAAANFVGRENLSQYLVILAETTYLALEQCPSTKALDPTC